MNGGALLSEFLRNPEKRASFSRWVDLVKNGSLFAIDGKLVRVELTDEAFSVDFWYDIFCEHRYVSCTDVVEGEPYNVISWEKMRVLTPLEALAVCGDS